MSFCGIICEYNPLHFGHIYHMQKTREIIKDLKGLICVMSGNFVQRGEIAVADKYTRAKWAILAGADIVLELPTVFAVSPAKDFAYGGINILSHINGVKYLSFGSEYGDIEKLKDFAKKLNDADISKQLKSGVSYASAFSQSGMYQSNNILGAEYLSAINQLGADIISVTIKREGGYNDLSGTGGFMSASAIRNMLCGGNYGSVSSSVPDYVFNDLTGFKHCEDALFDMVIYKILSLGAQKIEDYAYVSEGLHNRIYAAALKSRSMQSLRENIITKRYPAAKINRILLALLLDITKEKARAAKKSPPYARVLAVKSGSENMLSEIKGIKLIKRAEDYKTINSGVIDTDILATLIYSKIKNTDLNDISAGLNII